MCFRSVRLVTLEEQNIIDTRISKLKKLNDTTSEEEQASIVLEKATWDGVYFWNEQESRWYTFKH